MIRTLASRDDERGGNFIPDSDMVAILEARLNEPDAGRGHILDGFPRDIAQARLFDATDAGRLLDAAIELRIDEPTLVERLAGRMICPRCGASYHLSLQRPQHLGVCDLDGTGLVRRADDEIDAIRRRIAVYEQQTRPLVEHYGECGKLIVVDASDSPDEVFGRMVQLLLPSTAQSTNS